MNNNYIYKEQKKLRTGFTTGTCAAAAAKASADMLLSGKISKNVEVTLSSGSNISLEIVNAVYDDTSATCAVIKDSGDDPDVTNGIEIFATVIKIQAGIEIDGGIGIGRVTKKGLKIPVGNAAINPVPLSMIELETLKVCEKYSYDGGLKITVFVPNGAEIAKKTMNERLGILGGISILGTSGIVEPMSDRAIIETIKAEIDVLCSQQAKHILVTPGNYGRDFAKNTLGMDIETAVKCSNYIGETLDYCGICGLEKLTLIGHAGKLVKLAGGIMNTYSKVADCRMEILAAHSALCGMQHSHIKQIMDCITVEAAIEIMDKAGLRDEVWRSISEKISFHLAARTGDQLRLRFVVFTLEHGVLIDSTT